MIQNGAATVATNLRRLMAREGLTYDEVVAATELDERTVRALVYGKTNPHSRTLHKLARGLGIEMDELFKPPGQSGPRRFDRLTNTFVESVVAAHTNTFANWSEAEFDELYSRFGTGGQLTEEGVLAAAQAMNAKRDVCRQVAIILETSEADLLAEFVEVLYRRATERCNQYTAPDRLKDPVARPTRANSEQSTLQAGAVVLKHVQILGESNAANALDRT